MKLKVMTIAVLAVVWMVVLGLLGCGQGAAPVGAAPTEIALPQPNLKGKMSVEEAMAKRRSIRQFADKELTPAQVGQLAWAAQGITEPKRGLRTAPSAVASYPLEIYMAKKDGLFRYLPQGHKLVQLSKADVRGALSAAAMGQESVKTAPLDIVIVEVKARVPTGFAGKGERFVNIEAGHVGENIHLQAVAMGLGSVTVGAADDALTAKALNLPEGEAPLYMIPVGYPK
jgi:SagB-type dehydrogenase family enzyme